MVTIKYICIALYADDEGEGGTVSLPPMHSICTTIDETHLDLIHTCAPFLSAVRSIFVARALRQD